MPIRLELEKIKEYVKPFYNGCNFRLVFENKNAYIENGCYQFFIRGASKNKKLLSDELDEKHKIRLELTEAERIELLKLPPSCNHCHSHTHKKIIK